MLLSYGQSQMLEREGDKLSHEELFDLLMEEGWADIWDDDEALFDLLAEEETAFILDEGFEKEPSEEELSLLVPGYKQRILSGVLTTLESKNNGKKMQTSS